MIRNMRKVQSQTGINMLKAVEKFNEKITSEGRPSHWYGCRINTGVGYLGEMGSNPDIVMMFRDS